MGVHTPGTNVTEEPPERSWRPHRPGVTVSGTWFATSPCHPYSGKGLSPKLRVVKCGVNYAEKVRHSSSTQCQQSLLIHSDVSNN
jgi:hypothetical protein